MGHSRSLPPLFLCFFVALFISSNVSAADVPRLTLQKTSFSQTENISILYEGRPTLLTAQIIDRTDSKIEYKAILKKRDGKEYMDFVTAEPLKPGKYALKVWKDNDKLVDTFIYWGIDEPTPTARPQSKKNFIDRQAPTTIEAGKTYKVNVSFTPDRNYRGTLTDLVPFDAIIEASDAAQIKRPELLALRMPFDDDFEMSDPFGTVNPKEHLGISDHDGTDFAVPTGTAIFAVDDGEIVPYREANQYGITQAVQHSWGQTFYSHLMSTPSAQIGMKVKKGQEIGRSGNTGLSTGPHLHFGMKWEDEFVDGQPFIENRAGSPADQKMLMWEVDAKKGEKVTRSYAFTMPLESTREAKLLLGPAVSQDLPEHYTMEEEKFWDLKFALSPRE